MRYFLYMNEYGISKPVEVISRRGVRERKINVENEPKQGTMYVCMEMSQ